MVVSIVSSNPELQTGILPEKNLISQRYPEKMLMKNKPLSKKKLN